MNADHIAPYYQWLEYLAFGRSLERCRFHYLDATRGARRVLILGEGDGRFLSRLLSVNAHAHVDVIDASPRMLALAQARVRAKDRPRVRFHHADARLWQFADRTYDLIVTQFFLDCFSPADLAQIVRRLRLAMDPGGTWLVSEFQQPSQRLARWHAAAWLGVMYWFFQRSTGLGIRRLPPYRDLLAGAGLEMARQHESRFGLMVSQLWVEKETV